MKLCRKLLALAGLCLLLLFFSCKGEVSVTQSAEKDFIPEDKTGVVFSNPFKDTTKFEARAITYYSKHDVDYYQISVWYLDGLEEGVETSATNTIETLKITKDDAYTSKTMIFDNEGAYTFTCAAYTADNEMIAEDTVKKSLSFATAEFIIFYLVPKIKSQTADVSASITWSGDDITAIAHTLRFVRPTDGLDTTMKILQNGKCTYDDTALLPVIIIKESKYTTGEIALSDCEVSCMVGKNGDSYSFNLHINISEEAAQKKNYYSYDLLDWTRTYTDSNTLVRDNMTQSMKPEYTNVKGSDYWILLDDKIVKTFTLKSEGIYFSINDNDFKSVTAEEIIADYYRIDEYGNILTLGDYTATVCQDFGNGYDCWSKFSDYLYGAYIDLEPKDIAVLSGSIFEIENEETHVNSWTKHSLVFKAIRTPYKF